MSTIVAGGSGGSLPAESDTVLRAAMGLGTETKKAKEILYPQISVTGLGDYDRNSGYTDGAVDVKWKTTTFNH